MCDCNKKGAAQFEKVSLAQFAEAMNQCFIWDEEEIAQAYACIQLPQRATRGSAGYDFFLPCDIEKFYNKKEQAYFVPTGIRCKIDEGWMLSCVPKSGLGFKNGMRLSNTIGIIDSDYYGSGNEGHIMAKFSLENPAMLCAGDKFMQGIFVPYGIVVDDAADGVRDGGFGSTGR